jgi:hypothetical protein
MSTIIKIVETGKVLTWPRKVARVAETKTRQQPADLTPQLEGAFRLMGHDPATARIMAAGRRGTRPTNLREVGRGIGLSASAASRFARGRGLREATVKDGSGFLASDYAYAPDAEDPTSWRFLLTKQPGDGALGAYDSDLVQKAATALSVDEWAVNQPDVPKADLPAVKQTVAGAWTQSGLALADMPPALTEAALRRVFTGMGHSESAASVAAKGRA